MTSNTEARPILRVLVALDTSPESRAAADAASRLANLLGAELAGIFIEDLDLLDLCRSPMARQADLLTAEVQRLEDQELERLFRAQAERARQTLAMAAARVAVSWSFRVARGAVAHEIQQASSSADLVSLGRLGWSLRQRRLLGRTARHLLSARGRSILLTDRFLDLHRPLLLVYEGGEAGRTALSLLAQLRLDDEQILLIAVPELEPESRNEIDEFFQEGGLTLRHVEIGAGKEAERIGHLAQTWGCGLVILPLGTEGFVETRLQEILDRLHCPVLIVS